MANTPDEYPAEDAPRKVTPAEAPDDALASPTEGAYRQQQRSQRRTVIALLVAFAALLVGGYYFLYRPYTTQQVATRPPPAPPNTFNVPATAPAAPPSYSRLDVTPRTGNLPRAVVGSGKQTLTFTLTAVDGSITINRITLPFAQASGLALDTDCGSRTLTDGEQCAAQVTFEPTGPATLNAEILVNALRYDKATGKTAPLNTNIPVAGVAEAAAPPPPPPAPPPAATTAVAPAADPRAQRLAAARKAFLEQQQSSFGGGGTTASAPANNGRPVDANWRDIGFAQAISSFPVDMTRVVTMDKTIPAVIEIPIDTRNPSRAVAKVERDIYGNDGITPVIERGSTMIGRVASITDVAEEKVNISWQRLVRPDGVAFTFEGTTGDAMGRSGALAYIDNRWGQRFGSAVLAASVNALTALALNGNQTTTSAGGAFNSSAGSYLGGTSQTQLDGRALATQALEASIQPLLNRYIQQQQRIAPVRTVPKGTRITVFSNQDFWLKPIPNPLTAGADGVSDVTGVGGQARTAAAQPQQGQIQGQPQGQQISQGQQLPSNQLPPQQQPPKPVDTSLTGPTGADNMRQRVQQDNQANQMDQMYRGLPQGTIYNQGGAGQGYAPAPYGAAPYGATPYVPPVQQQPTGTPNAPPADQQLPPWAR